MAAQATPSDNYLESAASGRRRIALGVSYRGAVYQGWQSQLSGLGVQDQLEAALQQFLQAPVRTVCAGRTDTGVHGLMQVVHLDTVVDRREFSWIRGTNRYLPGDISVEWAREVPCSFHARACALRRRYSYLLQESVVRPSAWSGAVGWVFRHMEAAPLEAAAARLIGTHDFSSFRASGCQALSPVKTLLQARVTRRGSLWRFDFEADAFLHHMIRNIMGCLVLVGQGFQPPEWIDEVLAARRRDAAAPTFAPDGLYFLGPVYDPAWGLPERTAAYDWLP